MTSTNAPNAAPASPPLALFAEPFQQIISLTQTNTPLENDTRFPDAAHHWSDAERHAVAVAWSSGRPLLVRGEAGCGKSQLARAVAKVLGVELVMEVIHPRFEASDLKYREDPVRRLAQAQVVNALRDSNLAGPTLTDWVKAELDPGKFIEKGAIWQAFACTAKSTQLHTQLHWPCAVLLIDEIDKADADVPNALLDVLANRSFSVPATKEVVRSDAQRPPLVIITTNEDRELPAPFLRRCVVLNLQPPGADNDEQAFVNWVCSRALAHEQLQGLDQTASTGSAQPSESPMRTAAHQTWADRQAAAQAGLPTVGLAEFLDLLYSLQALAAGDASKAAQLLNTLSAYVLVKHRETPQTRPPVGASATAAAEPQPSAATPSGTSPGKG